MVRRNVQYELIDVKRCDNGQFVIMVCKIGTRVYLLANVYGPNDDDPTFYRNFVGTISSFDTDYAIIGGDFNFVINPTLDSMNYARQYNINAKNAFINFANEKELIDIWRVKNPTKLEYTWSRINPLKCGRLDMFFITSHLISSVHDVNIKPGYRTDHCMVTMTLHVTELERGPGLWKINDSVLKDPEYTELINTTIRNTVYEYAIPIYNEEYVSNFENYFWLEFTINDSLFYETLLMLIRGETVKYCKRKARNKRIKEEELQKYVETAFNLFNSNKNETNANNLKKAQEELENLRKPYIDGLIVRSRTQWYEKGERSSKYFLSLEKRNSNRKSIQYIESEGLTITKQKDIMSLFSQTLKQKYSPQQDFEPDSSFIKNNITGTLSEEEKSLLNKEITFDELTTALKCMKKGKTPGSNGFSVDFFRCFWNPVGIFLFRAFQESHSKGTILQTHRESIITLIPKAGKSSHSLKGWRPISLLNVDYKIVSTAIGNRFKEVIDKIINPSQSAYIKGRYIGENTRLVYDIITHVNENNESGLIMAADFEAAFETVSWPYLRLVLKEMNFGKYFRNIIDIMYLNAQNFSRILLNGFLGETIQIHRGIRQGDPVSGFLFNIAVEVLAKQILQSNKLTGIRLNTDVEARISQYADDTILFLDGSERSLIGVVEELSTFSAQSGLKLNWEKTSCLSLGSLNPPTCAENYLVNKIQWVEEIKILGLYFKRSLHNITENNLQRKIRNLECEIAQWNRRYITPLGKITVIKSLLLSTLVHLFITLPNPSQTYIKKIENMLYTFLWNNKPDPIKRAKVIQNYEWDGLAMVDIVTFISSLKLTWLKRLSNSTATWAVIAQQKQLDPTKLLMYGSQQLRKVKTRIKNVFWSEVISSLIQFNEAHKLTPDEIIREQIWFSDYTKYQTSFIPEWDRKGLRFIGDLFNTDTGNLLTREEIKTLYRISMDIFSVTNL